MPALLAITVVVAVATVTRVAERVATVAEEEEAIRVRVVMVDRARVVMLPTPG